MRRKKTLVKVLTVAGTRFTTEDQYLSKCSYINKKNEANRFLKMFPKHRKEF